jgi:riboflavin kinase/FMN adenylyltransferase
MDPLFSVSGRVIHGSHLGRKLGYPTANIALSDETAYYPLRGVYFTQVHLNERVYYGMANIGFRPSLENPAFTVEVNILDFEENIYNEILTVQFLQRLRDEKKFHSLEDLIAQMKEDEKTVRRLSLGFQNSNPNTL